jgi:hypothetical protein
MPSGLERATQRAGAVTAPGGITPSPIGRWGPMSSTQNHTSPKHNLKAGYRRKKTTPCRRDIVIRSLSATGVTAALVMVNELSVP